MPLHCVDLVIKPLAADPMFKHLKLPFLSLDFFFLILSKVFQFIFNVYGGKREINSMPNAFHIGY